jgi:hypothetical protein
MTMRHICVFLLCCFAIPVFAQQDTPSVETFVGYSYMNADVGLGRHNVNGGNFSFVANLNHWAGLEANFSAYNKTVSQHQFIQISLLGGPINIPITLQGQFLDFATVFGPRLRYKWAFVHTLFGVDDFSGSGVFGMNTSFAGALGGGALFKFSRHVGLEGSADYTFSHHNLSAIFGSPFTQNNLRVNAGIVFTFGHVGKVVPASSSPRNP